MSHKGFPQSTGITVKSPSYVLDSTVFLCSSHTILILSCSGPQAYKIRIILSFRRLPCATSSLIKTNSCLTQSYPVICEVLQAEVRPQIISTPFNRAVMLIGNRFRRMFLLLEAAVVDCVIIYR